MLDRQWSPPQAGDVRLTANARLFDASLAGGGSHTTHPSPENAAYVSALDAGLRFGLHPLLLRCTPNVRVAVTLLCRASSDNFLARWPRPHSLPVCPRLSGLTLVIAPALSR